MAFISLTTAETDAKSPLDDDLFKKIKDDLDDLDSRVVVAGASPYMIEVQGKLSYIANHRRSIAMGIVNEAFIPTRARYLLKHSGLTGSLGFDIRKHTQPNTPITAISHQYSAATSSIAQTGSALATQSIARTTAQIATQSITHAKAAINVQSIIVHGLAYIGETLIGSVVQYNLASALDADTLVGDSITFSGCTSGANNVTAVIIEIGRGGGANVLIVNASGVAQTGVAGSAQVKIMSFNFINPVSTQFAAPYSHVFAAHTTGANNGTFPVYAINQSGNNIWVKIPTGATQAGVAGNANTSFWTFALTGAASVTDYIVGESAKTAGHTTAANNVGALEIIAVNSGGNNLVLYNPAGVAQAGVAGTVNTNRWTYAMPSDPTGQVVAGYSMFLAGHTAAANNGTFTAKEVNRLGANNIIFYNIAGVAQAGAVGNTYTARKLVSFAADMSASYTTASLIEIEGVVEPSYIVPIYNKYWANAPFQVVQVNRGGGSNYNVVIEVATATAQASPAGYVQTEMKSIFSAVPSIASSKLGSDPNENLVGTTTALIATTIPANTPLMLYFTSIPSGDPRDFSISIR